MKNLRLNLKAVWYNLIESGEKKEEYREIKDYWTKRLTQEDGTFVEYDTITFVYGYTKREMTFKCTGIRVGKGNLAWGAPETDEWRKRIGNYFTDKESARAYREKILCG